MIWKQLRILANVMMRARRNWKKSVGLKGGRRPSEGPDGGGDLAAGKRTADSFGLDEGTPVAADLVRAGVVVHAEYKLYC